MIGFKDVLSKGEVAALHSFLIDTAHVASEGEPTFGDAQKRGIQATLLGWLGTVLDAVL
jgi:hypothetical protein